MKYIVLTPSCSEGRSSPDVKYLDDDLALEKFLLQHRGDLERVKIYEAKELVLDINWKEKK
jgi:hypothetical protein